MFPKFDTVSDKPNGLEVLRNAYNAYYTVPNIINSNFDEGLANEEIESIALVNSIKNNEFIAADELGGGKQDLSQLGLDEDFLGNTLLRKSLGYLSDEDNLPIEAFVEGTEGNTRNNFLKVMKGKTDEVLKTLKDKEDKPDSFQLYSYFTPTIDPDTGEYTLKQVVGTKEAMAKVELAGSSVINSYGPKSFSGNSLLGFTNSFARGMHGMLPGMYSFAAGVGDLGEAVSNLVTDGEFKSEYDSLNALADYRQEEITRDTPYGKTSIKADQSIFDNLESFSNVMGNVMSSLLQYSIGGRALAGPAGAIGLAEKTGKAAKSLGAIGKSINGMIKGTPELLPMLGSGMILNYGEAYQAARDAGLSLEDAASVGFITGALNTVIEQKLGSNALTRWLATGKSGKTAAQAVIAETGGDMSKLFDRGISNKIVNSIMNTVDRLSASNKIGLGSAFEEGLEEFLQNQAKNSIETLYDTFVAPDDVEIGRGRFGTDMFAKSTLKESLEEGAAGAIAGLFGGFIHSRVKEDRSIIPFIASGEYDTLLAGMNLALQKGAISQQQYDGLKQRADGLNTIYQSNKDLFYKVAQYDPKNQMKISEGVMKQLRDQDDYIKNTKNGLDDNFNSFVKLLNGASRVVVDGKGVADISTVDRFADALEEAGRNEEADIIKRSRSDAKDKVKKILPKPKKFGSDVEKAAWLQARKDIENSIYTINTNRQIDRLRNRKISGEVNTMLSQNPDLQSAVDSHFTNNISYNETIAAKKEAIRNAKTDEEIDKAVEDARNYVIRHAIAFEQANGQVTNVHDYAIRQAEATNNIIDDVANTKRLESLTKDKSYSDKIYNRRLQDEKLYASIKAIEDKLKEAEARTKKIQDYFTSDEYKGYLDGLINDPNTTDEFKGLAQAAKEGNIGAQLQLVQDQRKETVQQLNKTPVSQKEDREALKQRLKDQDDAIEYLKNKKDEEDKELARATPQPVKADFSSVTDKVTDNNGKEYTLNPNATMRSEKYGFVYILADKDGNTKEVSQQDLLNHNIEDKSGNTITLAQLAAEQERLLDLERGRAKVNLTAGQDDDFDPTEHKTKLREDYTKDDRYAGGIRMAADSKFETIINNPKTDVSKFPISFKISQNIESLPGYAKEKAAKKKYLKLLESSDPIAALNEMSEVERNEMIQYLPIQGTISNRGYSNIIFSFSNASVQKTKLVNELLKNKGEINLPAGHIIRTPGYVNYQSGTSNSLKKGLNLKVNKNGEYALPNGTPLRIGIADASSSIYYLDPEGKSDYLLVANAAGNPGTPYLIIPGDYQLTGEDGYVAKLNPKKIPLGLATNIAKIFADISSKKIRLKDVVAENNEYGITSDKFGYITYAQVLNHLIYFGDTTKESKREPKKTLFIDYDNRGVIRYGETQQVLKPNDEASIADFARWISTNKNFAISRASLNNDIPIKYGFTMKGGDASVSFKTGSRYLNAVVDNELINTDLDISKGLIGNSYLVIQDIPTIKPTVTSETAPGTKAPKKSESGSTTEFSGMNDALNILKKLPNETSLVPVVKGLQRTANKYGVVIRDGKIYSMDGTELGDISAFKTDKEAWNGLRKILVDEYNRQLDKQIQYEKDHPEAAEKFEGQPTDKSGLKISTKVFKGSGVNAKFVDNPTYYEKVSNVKITLPKEVKPAAEAKRKPKPKSKEAAPATETNPIGLNKNNPFSALEQTPEIQKLSETYDKLIDYVSTADSKMVYISGIRSMLRNPKAIPSKGISKEDLSSLLEYVFPDGNSVGRILLNLGEVVTSNKKQPIAPIKSKPVAKKEAAPSSDEKVIINDKTSPLSNKLTAFAKDPAIYQNLIDKYRNEFDQMDSDEMKQLLSDMNDQIADSLPQWQIYNNIRKGTLSLREKPGNSEIKNTPVADSPMTPEEMVRAAGITEEQIGLKRRKPKGKFDTFGKKPSAPMQVYDNQGETDSLRKQIADYRRMLSKRAGGNLKVVDKLIKIIGESGRPGWAWSIMNEDGITLFERPAEGAAYHEAFHRVSLLLLKPEEQARMYSLARREYSLYNRSDNEVEEFLAERFRESVLEDGIKDKGKLSQILSDMWTAIKTFLNLNKTKIDNLDSMFKAIKNGKYKFAKINKAALSNFNQRYANADAPLTINGVTLHQIYNSSLLGDVVNSLTAMTLDLNGISSIESIENGISFKEVTDNLIDIRDKHLAASQNEAFGEFQRAVYQEKADMYDEIIDNFDTVFKPLIDVKLQGYNIRKIENNLTYKDDLNDLVNDEIRSAYEFSVKDNAQADIRVLFLTLRSSEALDPNTFLPSYVNPDVAWYNTFSTVHTAKSIDDMLNRLKRKADETNTLRQSLGDSSKLNMYSELYDILTAQDENGNQNEALKTRFWNTFKKHRNKFINGYFNQETNDKGKAVNSYSITYGDADVNKRSGRLEKNWSALFGINGTFANKEVLTQAVDDYKKLISKSKTRNFLTDDYSANAMELVRILNSVNIGVDMDSIGVLLNRQYFNSNLNVSLKNLINSIPRAGKKDPVGLNQLFGEKGLFNDIINEKIDNITENALNLLSKEKAVSELAKAYVAANPTAEDDSVIGPDGNLVYAYSENNTITSMFEEWVKDDAIFQQLNAVIYNRSSQWLSQMQDPEVRNNIGVETMLSLIDRDSYDTGRGYLEIAPNEDLLLKFNALRVNKLPLPTLANKRTFYFVNGLKRQEVSIQDGKINRETVDVFTNYAINEYAVIQEAIKAKDKFLKRLDISEEEWNNMSGADQKALLKDKNENYKELVENYHYIMKGGSMKLTGNGYKFRYFSSLQNKLNDSKFFDINNEKLRSAINSYLIQQVNNTIKQFINQKLIVGDKSYANEELIKEKDDKRVNTKIIHRNNLLPGEIIKSKSTESIDLAEAIADYAINTAISVYEFEKIVSGDVAYYKGSKNYQAMLDDRVKRYSALTSTKSILREDYPEDFLDFDTHKYHTAIFNTNIVKSQTMYDEMMRKYVGTDENHGLLWKQYERFREDKRKGFDGLTDEELKLKVIQEADRRLNGYLDVDQTDAQVLISPKMFRKLAIMNGEWNNAKESAYDLMESDEPLTLEQELEAYSVVMQPLKYVHFGYDFFNGLQVPIYDKMSLATVFKRVAKGRDLQKVYDFMNDNDVDMIKFDTAVKSGLRQKGTFYEEGNINDELSDIPVYEQSFKYLGKQLVTDPHHVSRISLGTQMAKIGVAGVEDNTIYEVNGTKYTGAQLINDYVGAISKLSDIGRENLRSDFGISEITENGKTYMTIDRNKFVSMLKDDAINSNMPSNLIDALKVQQNEDGNTEYYVELSGIPALTWIQSRIISMIKKETIDINTPGGAMIQMSNFGYKDSTVEVDVKNYNYEYNKELRFKDKNNRLEAVVSINLFKDVLPKDYLIQQTKANGTTYFEEAKKFILDNPDLAALSYRIPTQGMNSTLPIVIKDVLPANVGDTIVLPAELTKLTGADFDVDKMYIARYNYDVIGGKMYKTEFVDDYDGLDEDGNPVFLSNEDYLKKVYDHRYRWFNTDFYKQAKQDVPRILQSVLVDVNRNGALTEDSIDVLISMRDKYSAFIGQRKFNSILNDPTLTPNQKVVKLASSFKFEDRKMTLEEFLQENEGKGKWEMNDHRQIENRLLDVFQATLTSDNHYMDATVPLDFATDALKEAVKVVDGYSNINSNFGDLEPLFPMYQENVKTQNVGADAGIGPMALINTFRVIMQISKLNLDKTLPIKFKRGKTTITRNLLQLIPNINNLYDKFDANGVSIMDWTSALINAHVDAAKDSYITRLNVNSYTYDVVALLTSAGVGVNQFYFLPQPILKEIANEAIRRSSSKIGLTKKERRDRRWRDGIVNEYAKRAKLNRDFYDLLDKGELTIEYKGENRNVSDLVMDEDWLKDQLKSQYEKNFTQDWYRNQVIIYEYFKDIQNYSKALSNLVLASQVDTGKMGKNEAELLVSLHNIESVMKDPHFTNVEDVFNQTFLGKKLNNSTGLLFDLLKNEVIDFSSGYINLINKFGQLSNTYFDKKPTNISKAMSEIKFAIQSEFFNKYIEENRINLKDMFYGNNTIVDRVDRLRNQILSGTKYDDLSDNLLLKMLIPGINQEGKPKKFETVMKLRDTDGKNAYTYAWRDLLEHNSLEVRDIAKDLIVYSFYTSGGRGTGIYATLDLVPYEVLGNMAYTRDGEYYTYNQYLRDMLRKANDNALDAEKYLDYAFRALQGSEDIVQEATVNRSQIQDGQMVYMTVDEDAYLTSTGDWVPYLQSDGTLFKLVGYLVEGDNTQPVYASTNSINYKEKGFNINEGTTSTFIDNNKKIDATDLSIPFDDKFLRKSSFVEIQNAFNPTSVEVTTEVFDTANEESEGINEATQEQNNEFDNKNDFPEDTMNHCIK